MGSKKESSVSPANVQQQIDPFSQQAADIAQQLFTQTDPLRQQITGQFAEMFGATPAANTGTVTGATQGFPAPAPRTFTLPTGQQFSPFFGGQFTPQTFNTPSPSVQGASGPNIVEEFSSVEDVMPFIQDQRASLTVDPDVAALFGGAKAAAESQFQRAQERAMELLPTGGSLNSALVGLEGDRAFGLSQILADLALQQAAADERGLDRAIGLGGAQLDINQRNIDRALNLASGGAAQALQGFGVGGNLAATSAATQAGIANANAQRNADKKGGTGELVGTLGSAYMSKPGCWVARAAYGNLNLKWTAFRWWLFNSAPGWFRRLYLKHGEAFAQHIKNRPIARAIIRRMMDAALGAAHGR